MYFNSQPHEEADFIIIAVKIDTCYFNSQPHEEADPCLSLYCFAYSISTRSLTRRLTVSCGNICCIAENFNSQPHEEADYKVCKSSYMLRNFNSQPHEEADFCSEIIAQQVVISTRSLTRRLTFSVISIAPCEAFQLAASRGG